MLYRILFSVKTQNESAIGMRLSIFIGLFSSSSIFKASNARMSPSHMDISLVLSSALAGGWDDLRHDPEGSQGYGTAWSWRARPRGSQGFRLLPSSRLQTGSGSGDPEGHRSAAQHPQHWRIRPTTCICVTESLCCTAEIFTMYINHT